jgi:hypothetical protein
MRTLLIANRDHLHGPGDIIPVGHKINAVSAEAATEEGLAAQAPSMDIDGGRSSEPNLVQPAEMTHASKVLPLMRSAWSVAHCSIRAKTWHEIPHYWVTIKELS